MKSREERVLARREETRRVSTHAGQGKRTEHGCEVGKEIRARRATGPAAPNSCSICSNASAPPATSAGDSPCVENTQVPDSPRLDWLEGGKQPRKREAEDMRFGKEKQDCTSEKQDCTSEMQDSLHLSDPRLPRQEEQQKRQSFSLSVKRNKLPLFHVVGVASSILSTK